MREEENK